MRKQFFIVTSACLAIVSLSCGTALAQSSSSEPKVEAGAQFTLVHFRDLGVTDVGVGGRVTYNFNDNFRVEGEIDYFPKDNQDLGGMGRKTEGFFGGLLGFRSSGFGIYSKIRPGFIHFTRDPFAVPFSTTDFAIDLGGVVEVYPSRRSVVRFDIGDTAIRFGSQTVLPTPIGPVATGTFWSHNLQFSAGVGVRF
jgi:hypothetical protein